MPDLLLELFSEEIPARMQARAAEDLKKLVTDKLVEAGLTYADAAAFSTPRRLCLHLTGLPKITPAMREERKGPRIDAPEKALEGFLRSTGLTKDQLEARDDKKGQVWFAVIEKPGREAAEVIAGAVTETVRNFPWPKSMRWGAGSLRWVRPLHSILCILHDEHGPEVVPFEIDGIASGDTTSGHRFMGPGIMGGGRFAVHGFEDYAHKLAEARVILDPAERAARIEHDATQLAFAQGMEVVEDKGLLAEVAGLVEWPVTLMGEIGEEFLDLPPEVLQTSMKTHQKFFSVRNPKTSRIERFITVANIEAPDHGETILAGNSRVLTARLADAQFFWNNDLRKKLDEMAAPLANVVFHAKLGTQAERIERIAALAREIAPKIGADPDLAEQAAKVAKADLASEMVFEFPELQGVMGGYYARAAGLPDEVATACEAHYRPLGPSDEVPSEPVSVAVALADKIDILTGFWAIDEKPTGSKDPFALRRAALGVIRIILANKLRIDLFNIVANRIASPKISHDLVTFISQRLEQALRDKGVKYDAIRTIFLHGPSNIDLATIEAIDGPDALDRPFATYDLYITAVQAEALARFLGTEDGANLLTGYRRASNIVAAEEKKDGVEYSGTPEAKFAEQDEEHALFSALDAAEPAIAEALRAEDFAAAMGEMAKLRPVIDSFFDGVKVNADNQIVRRNRLCLLNRIRSVMRQVAVWEAIEG